MSNNSSKRHKFAAGLVYIPNFVSSFTTLTTLTLLGCISVFLANNQLDWGMFLLDINTRSPTTKLRVGMFRFLGVVMMGKYSGIYLCQNDPGATWTTFNFCLFAMPPGFSTGHINQFGLAAQLENDLVLTPQSSWCHHSGRG